ncbi:7-deoxyloganetic acid glucosyltransferase-like protein [Carex littledalei]|uniref:7-deoxyloganetic acid glucosyltransferase-like protein n=1 Tax=Carex littledalei TaxID=544730 RepID=A0A833VR67_9POAL|nr:7-deoxyloganetic acid glucosyltransferase-like protein [Carex littledalei]
MAANKNNPHVLIFPYPSQGPLNCMMKLAELLAVAGLHVTLLNTEDTHHRLSLSSASLPTIPLLRFKSIPDGLPDDQPRDASLLIDVAKSLNMNSRLLLRDLLLAKPSGDTSDAFPPVSCVIVDGFLPFVVDLSEEIGLPCLSFRTPSACSIWAYLCTPKLFQNGELPFREGVDLDELVKGVPGMEGFLRRRDLPEFFRGVKTADDPKVKFMATVSAYSGKTRGFILNTTEVLESTAVHHIRSQIPVTYAVGPLHAILKSYRSACGSTDASSYTSSESAARFRQSARDMADAVKESIAEGGSSFREFHRLIEDIKSMSNSVVLN